MGVLWPPLSSSFIMQPHVYNPWIPAHTYWLCFSGFFCGIILFFPPSIKHILSWDILPAITAELTSCARLSLCVSSTTSDGVLISSQHQSLHLISYILRPFPIPTILGLVLPEENTEISLGYVIFVRNQYIRRRKEKVEFGLKKWKSSVDPTESLANLAGSFGASIVHLSCDNSEWNCHL